MVSGMIRRFWLLSERRRGAEETIDGDLEGTERTRWFSSARM